MLQSLGLPLVDPSHPTTKRSFETTCSGSARLGVGLSVQQAIAIAEGAGVRSRCTTGEPELNDNSAGSQVASPACRTYPHSSADSPASDAGSKHNSLSTRSHHDTDAIRCKGRAFAGATDHGFRLPDRRIRRPAPPIGHVSAGRLPSGIVRRIVGASMASILW